MLTSDEFLGVWVQDGVGPPLDAVVFFHNADVNKDGVLTAKSDLLAIFQSFDRDGEWLPCAACASRVVCASRAA